MKKELLLGTILLLSMFSCGNNQVEDYTIKTFNKIDEEGILTVGAKYYKVKEMISGQRYFIGYLENNNLTTLGNDDKGCIFDYTYNSTGSSTSKPSTALFMDTYYLDVIQGELQYLKVEESSFPSPRDYQMFLRTNFGIWTYQDSYLQYQKENLIYYVSYLKDTFQVVTDKEQATPLTIYTNGETLSQGISKQINTNSYVLEDSFTLPTYSIEVDSKVTIDDVKWYLNEEENDTDNLSFTIENLTKEDIGVYPLYAKYFGHDEENYYYREKTYTTNFIIAKGTLENTLLTFSDVHEEFSLIGKAIQETMDQNEGKIPSLVVATGDWVNGPTPADEILENVYLPQVQGQIGGIDAVYVAGNHESYLSVAKASIASSLGADETNLDGVGVIFDSRSQDYLTHARSSKNIQGLIVFGINYFALEKVDEEGKITYTYENVIPQLKEVLDSLKDQYQGEMILISAHAGLHTLGLDPHSDVEEVFGGKDAYNIEKSNEMVDLLNEYALSYQMNFSFQFGHNHSKQESEFLLTPGERIYTTKSYLEKSVVNEEIQFSYGHMGYLSTSII